MLQAKVNLIDFLQTLSREQKDPGVLDDARRLCVELEPFVEQAFNDCRSLFYVAYASAQLQSGSTDFEKMEQMIERAKELNPWSFRVREVERNLIKHRYPNGGVGKFNAPPFE